MPQTVIFNATKADPLGAHSTCKIDKCANGVLWVLIEGSGGSDNTFYYSDNNGVSWNASGIVITADPQNILFFIDSDDYLNIIYFSGANLIYRRGTPNAARTSYTITAAVTAHSTAGNSATLTDFIAFVKENKTVFAYTSAFNSGTIVQRIGVFTADFSATPIITTLINNADLTSLNVVGSSGLCFEHTGNHKTPATNPHIWACWAHNSGTKGIGLKKATYSAGPTYTLGAETEVRAAAAANVACVQPFWNTTDNKLLLVVVFNNGLDVVIYDRDSANTTSTLLDSETFTTATALNECDIAVDNNYNVYIIGQNTDEGNTVRDLVWTKWTKATASWGAQTVLDTATGGSTDVNVIKLIGNRLHSLYLESGASTGNVVYDYVYINNVPDVPTGLVVTSVLTDTTPNFECSVNDVDFSSSEQVKARFTLETLAGAAIGTVDSTFRASAGVVTAEYTSALSPGQYRVKAKAIDDDGAESAETTYVNFNVTTIVTKDNQLIFDTKSVVQKDIETIWDTFGRITSNIDLEVKWQVFGRIEKDYVIVFDTRIPLEKDLNIFWDNMNGWVDIPTQDTVWTELEFAP